jgi:hypothetical protein
MTPDYSDPGSVVEALRRAGYTVHHMSHDYGTHGTDCVEAIIDACADGAVPLPLGVAARRRTTRVLPRTRT